MNVLAVIDEDRAAIARAYGEVAAAHDGRLADHDAMRAAVAELITAIEERQHCIVDTREWAEACSREVIALARCKGAA